MTSYINPIDLKAVPSSMQGYEFIACSLTLLYELGFRRSTWKLTKEEVLKNNYLAETLALLVVASTINIMWKSLMESTEEVSKAICSRYIYNKATTISSLLYPRQDILRFQICATILNVLGLLVSNIMFENLSDNEKIQICIEIVICLSTFLLYQKSTLDILEDALVYFKLLFGNEEEKKLIQTIYEFNNLANFINTMNPEYFEKMLPQLSESVSL